MAWEYIKDENADYTDLPYTVMYCCDDEEVLRQMKPGTQKRMKGNRYGDMHVATEEQAQYLVSALNGSERYFEKKALPWEVVEVMKPPGKSKTLTGLSQQGGFSQRGPHKGR